MKGFPCAHCGFELTDPDVWCPQCAEAFAMDERERQQLDEQYEEEMRRLENEEMARHFERHPTRIRKAHRMEISKSAPEGNAHAIMGAVQSLLKQVGRGDEVPEVLGRMMSGDYENLCAVATEVTNGTITFTD